MDLDAALKSFAEDMRSLRHSREDVSGEAVIAIPGCEKRLSGGAVNLSLGGVGVLLDAIAPDLSTGKAVNVTLRWPDGDEVTVDARVAWQGPADKDGASYGLVFGALDSDRQEHINRHLIARVINRNLTDE